MRYKDTITSGVLLVDKAKGITSHDVVDAIRRQFGISKVGHAGTLDPMATGLLVMLIGKATKLSRDFLNDDKAYEAHMILGVTTDTADASGKILERKPSNNIKKEDVIQLMEKFKGEIEQIPPMFSAKRHRGKKLYQYARKGIEVVRKPRKVTIKELRISAVHIPEVSIWLRCSKGTYVRQLAVDIGEALGCGAHLTDLRRVASGEFLVENALKFDKLKEMTIESLNENLIHFQKTLTR